jgi:hypothetical protein
MTHFKIISVQAYLCDQSPPITRHHYIHVQPISWIFALCDNRFQRQMSACLYNLNIITPFWLQTCKMEVASFSETSVTNPLPHDTNIPTLSTLTTNQCCSIISAVIVDVCLSRQSAKYRTTARYKFEAVWGKEWGRFSFCTSQQISQKWCAEL